MVPARLWPCLLILILLLVPAVVLAVGDSSAPEDLYLDQLQELDLAQVEQLLAGIDAEVRQLLPELNIRSLLLDPTGQGWGQVFRKLLNNLIAYFFREIVANAKLMGQLLALAVCLSLLTQLQGSFGDKSFQELVYAVCYLVLILVGLRSFNLAVNYGITALTNMVSLMQALLPTYALLLTSIGAVTTAALLSPIMYGLLTIVSSLIGRVVLPLLFFSVVVGLVGNISGKFSLSQLAGFLRQAATVTLGLLFTTFLGATVVRGVTAPVTDGVALRATKFLAGSFVPVVGKMYSDAIEVVVGSSLLLKNAVGLLGILLILALSALPMIKIVAMLVVYKFVNAVVEPISDSQLTKGLGQLESGLTMLFVVVATVSIFFFVSLTIIISAGNLAVVMRG